MEIINKNTNYSKFVKTVCVIVTSAFMFKTSKWLIRYIKRVIALSKVKGPWMLPIIGNLHQLKSKKDWLKQLAYYSSVFKDEPVWRVWFGWNPVIVFHRAESSEIILSDSRFIDKPQEYSFFKPWLGEGLITSDGEKWQTRRRLLTPAFRYHILEDFLGVMNEQVDIMIEKLTKFAKEGTKVDILRVLHLCALDIIAETALGQHPNAQINEEAEFVKALYKGGDIIMLRMVNPLLWYDSIYYLTSLGREQNRVIKTIHEFTRNAIEQRAADFEVCDYVPKRIAFLDTMLKAKQSDPTMTFKDVQEEVDTFMAAGMDTTAASMSWALFLLGWHPDVQKKVRDEVDRILGNTNKFLTMEDLKNLEYVECVIKESLRILPSVPFFGRRLSEDVQIGKYLLKKGETAMIAPFCIHRDERYWPNPERFDPDRFLPENSKDRHPCAYIPFAAGRRTCIGQRYSQMEEKVVIANICRRFEIKSLHTIEELNLIPEMALRTSKTMYLEFKLRF